MIEIEVLWLVDSQC